MSWVHMHWFLVLLPSVVVSVFIHEVAHGVSAVMRGLRVSTGFNRVGDIYRRPGQPDFRQQSSTHRNPWDLGPAVTLVLASALAASVLRVEGYWISLGIGALAVANSLLRLVPMVMAYGSLLVRGRVLAMEDEIWQGRMWREMSGIGWLEHAPPALSVTVSSVCLYVAARGLSASLPQLTAGWWLFALISPAAFALSWPVLNLLDEHCRINWGR